MPRSRRAFLATVGASTTLAGCTVRAPGSTPRYRLSATVPSGAENPFRFELADRRNVATGTLPMVVRLTYENTQPAETTREVVAPRSPTILGDAAAESSLALLDPDTGYKQRTLGSWTPATDRISVLLGLFTVSDLPAGTTLHLNYAVWQNPRGLDDGEHRLQPGTYRIPRPFDVGAGIELVVEEL